MTKIANKCQVVSFSVDPTDSYAGAPQDKAYAGVLESVRRRFEEVEPKPSDDPRQNMMKLSMLRIYLAWFVG